MPGDKKNRPAWIRHSGMGLEFGAAVAGFTIVGYWIDEHYGCSPKGVLIGAGLGIFGGGYNFVREASSAMKQAEQRRKTGGDEHDG